VLFTDLQACLKPATQTNKLIGLCS